MSKTEDQMKAKINFIMLYIDEFDAGLKTNFRAWLTHGLVSLNSYWFLPK